MVVVTFIAFAISVIWAFAAPRKRFGAPIGKLLSFVRAMLFIWPPLMFLHHIPMIELSDIDGEDLRIFLVVPWWIFIGIAWASCEDVFLATRKKS